MNPQEQIKAVKDYLTGLQENIESYQKLLSKVVADTEEAEKQRNEAKDNLAEFSKACGVEVEKLHKELTEYKTEVHKLEGEISALVSEKSQLKLDNASLYKQNESFREYEGKAMKVLKATETSLIERENVLKQRENLRPHSSILPPQS